MAATTVGTPQGAASASIVSSITVTLATGVATGDIDYMAVNVQAASVGLTTPTGWTLVKNQTESSSVYTSVYRRVRQSGDPATVAVTVTGATSAYGWVAWAVTGANTTTPEGTPVGSADTTSNTTHTTPALTTTGTGSLRVVVAGLGGSATFSTAPAGTTTHKIAGGGKNAAVATAANATPASVAASSWTLSAAARGTSITFEVLAASAATLAAAGAVDATSATIGAVTSRLPSSGTVAVVSATSGAVTSKLPTSGAIAATSTTAGAATIVPAPTLPVTDTFTRADSGSLNNAESGHPWVQLYGTTGVVSNKAQHTATALVAGYNSAAVIVDAGISDVTVSSTFGSSTSLHYEQMRVRQSGSDTYYRVQHQNNGEAYLIRDIAGVGAVIATGTWCPATSHVHTLTAKEESGSTRLILTIDGTERYNGLDSTVGRPSGTQHGMSLQVETSATYVPVSFDDFTVAVPASGPATLAATGTVAAVSATTGNATRVPLVLSASGTVASTSTTAGTVTARLTAAGTTAAVSATTGSVTARLGTSGTVAATSTTSGSPGILGGPVTHVASGTVAATSATTGSVTARLGTSGSIAATTTSSGTVTARLTSAGVVTVISGTSGAVSKLAAVSGVLTVISGTSGDATIIVGIPLDDPTYGTVSGALRVDTATGTLRTHTATGALRVLAATGTVHTEPDAATGTLRTLTAAGGIR